MADVSIERYNKWINDSNKYIDDVKSHDNDIVSFLKQLDDSQNEGYKLIGQLDFLIESLKKDSKVTNKYLEMKNNLEQMLNDLQCKKLNFFQ